MVLNNYAHIEWNIRRGERWCQRGGWWFPLTICKFARHPKRSYVPMCVSSICWMRSPKLGKVIPQPFHLQMLIKNTAISSRMTADQNGCARVLCNSPHTRLTEWLTWITTIPSNECKIVRLGLISGVLGQMWDLWNNRMKAVYNEIIDVLTNGLWELLYRHQAVVTPRDG